jgi:hypothetical protein
MVPPGPRQARDEPSAYRVRRHCKHDRGGRRGLLCGQDIDGARGEDDIDLEPGELGGDLGGAFPAALRPTVFNRDAATFDPTELAQPLHKSGDQLALGRRRA